MTTNEARETVWIVFAQFWVDTSYDDDQLDRFAVQLRETGLSISQIERIVQVEVAGAFASDTLAMYLSAGMSLDDWFYPDDEAVRHVRRWLARPNRTRWIDPTWILGRLLARSFIRDDWSALRTRLEALA